MKKKLVISILTLFTITCVFSIPPVDDGKLIFTSRCASCHNVNKIVVGPALAGVSERHPEDWIVKFVHSSQTVIKGGDKAAVDLYEKFNKVPMPDHPDLSTDNIKSILAYIKSETKKSSASRQFPARQTASGLYAHIDHKLAVLLGLYGFGINACSRYDPPGKGKRNSAKRYRQVLIVKSLNIPFCRRRLWQNQKGSITRSRNIALLM